MASGVCVCMMGVRCGGVVCVSGTCLWCEVLLHGVEYLVCLCMV